MVPFFIVSIEQNVYFETHFLKLSAVPSNRTWSHDSLIWG